MSLDSQLIPTNLLDPRLADYSNLKDRQLAALAAGQSGGTSDGLFMAEGELVVRQLLRSGLRAKSILITPTRLETMRDALAVLPPDTPIYLIPQSQMDSLVGFPIHRGILVAGFRPKPRSADEVAATSQTLLILEDLANHDNVGGIFRAAAGLAGTQSTGILLSPRCCDPLYRKAIRVSIGTALRIPFATIDPWPDALTHLKSRGFTTIALTPGGEHDITALPRRPRPALLLGSEGRGLSSEALAAVDLRVRIPIDPEVDSLNVVMAAGIALHRLANTPQ
jgi:tRNA G18 (ribose-2'-O)-methylase SpoU